MGYNFNIGHDDAYYAEQLAPYLLNAIYEMSAKGTNNKVLKIGAFDACSAGGHKGDQKNLEKYKTFKGDNYYRDVQNALEVLYRRVFATPHSSPGHVSITEAGIQMCERPVQNGGWHYSVFHPDKIDPHLI